MNRETEQIRVPESGNIIEVDPSTLMEDNPAALIVNRESYQRMEAHFSPLQLDPPQVVWVKTYSREHDEAKRLFVVDGLTRTKFSADHKGTVLPDYPNFSFDSLKVRDVTASTLRNSTIVPEGEHDKTADALTMLQYLRAVVPPTAEHSEIVSDRIAAHLINGWDNMVGEELAEKFSALAALDYLVQGPLGKIPLQSRLKRQGQLVANEGPEDRVALEEGLREMAAIIEEAHLTLRKKDVLQSAFILVSAGSPVIGGDRQAFRQVYGMLSTPEVDRKLAEAATEVGTQDDIRVDLGKTLVETLNRFVRSRDRYAVIDALTASISDPSLSLKHVENIALATDPAQRHRETKINVNSGRVTSAYTAVNQIEELSPTEAQLLSRLGGVPNLEESAIPAIVRSINGAEEILRNSQEVRAQLLTSREELRNSGVSLATLQEANRRLDELEKGVLSVDSTQGLSRKVKELRDTLVGVERNVAREVNAFRVDGIVRSTYGNEAQEGYGSLVRKQVVNYILREVDPRDEEAIVERLQQLRALDPVFQSRVIDSRENMRIETALRLQRQRQHSVSPQRQPEVREAAPLVSGQVEEHVILDKQAAEETRKRVNNEKLITILQRSRSEASVLDIEDTELTREARREIEATLRFLAKLRNRNHPDAVKAVDNYYEQVERDVNVARNRIYKDQEKAAKDTRTGH